MDELINVLVIWVVGIVAGMVLHSAGGHAGYNQRARDWIERHLLGKEDDDPFDCSKPRGARYPDCENGPSPLCKHCSKDTDCGRIIMKEKEEDDELD